MRGSDQTTRGKGLGPAQRAARSDLRCCPRPQDCQNRCCNASTCLLAKGAECAHGSCCHECRVSLGFWGTAAGVCVQGPPVPWVSSALLNQVKLAGEPCRPAKDQCDLGEYCDGRQPMCPEDAFWENGTPCPGGYCYNGACPTVAQRCRDLWGPGEAGMGPGHGPLRPARVAAGPESSADLLLPRRRSGCHGDVLQLQHLHRLQARDTPGLWQVSVHPWPDSPGSRARNVSTKRVLCTKESGS